MMIINHVLTNTTSTPFENKHVLKLLKKYIRKIHEKYPRAVAVDPFARESCTSINGMFGSFTISNDLNSTMPTDFHLEANDFGEYLLARFQRVQHRIRNIDVNQGIHLVFFDPPYTLRMLKDHYDGIGKDLKIWQCQNMWGRCRDSLAKMMPEGSYCITLGYSTRGMGRHRGFRKREILILESGGKPDRYDILMTIEEKVQTNLLHYIPQHDQDDEE